MIDSNKASTLHKQAAVEHQEAAQHHLKAAECHDDDKLEDAQASSKSAMDCCNTAQEKTKSACGCSTN
jgi:hypothetical protein